jgi:hypothetical protein
MSSPGVVAASYQADMPSVYAAIFLGVKGLTRMREALRRVWAIS